MTTYGCAIDSVGHPPGAAVVAAGYRAVCLYVGTPGRAKSATRALIADYRAHGLDLVFIYEDGAGTWRSGRARGLADALAVRADLANLGVAWDDVPCVYHAYDSDVLAKDLKVAEVYAAGVAAGYGGTDRVGAYGARLLITDLLDRGCVRYAWAAAGWQYGHIDPRTVLHQRVGSVGVAGVPCDINEILSPDFGQFPAARGSAAQSVLAPALPTASEDAVALIEFDPTPVPPDPAGGRWQDTHPSTWPRSAEMRTALLPAVADGWRGLGSISSITCGWAANQDGPGPDGAVKPSGFIEYIRVFYFGDRSYQNWLVTSDIAAGAVLTGNRSLPPVMLPNWSTFLVIRYAAPGGMYLGVEYQR